MRGAVRRHKRQIGNAAGGDERGRRAGGKAEDADPAGVEMRASGPALQHEIDRAADVARALRQPFRPADAAVVLEIVAPVHRRGDDESGAGQRLGGVDMGHRTGAGAVRDDHQGKVIAGHARRSSGFAPGGRMPDGEDHPPGTGLADRDLLNGDGMGGLSAGGRLGGRAAQRYQHAGKTSSGSQYFHRMPSPS